MQINHGILPDLGPYFLNDSFSPKAMGKGLHNPQLNQRAHGIICSGEINNMIGPGPSRFLLSVLLAATLHQNFNLPALPNLISLYVDLSLPSLEFHQPPAAHFFGDFILEFGRPRMGPVGIFEGEKVIELYLLHHVQGRLEIRLFFARETDNQIRGDADLRAFPPELIDLFQILFPGIPPIHPFQDAIGSRLQGKMDVLAEFGKPAKGSNELRGKVFGVGSGETDAINSPNLLDGLQ
jgi:hypothetical protein